MKPCPTRAVTASFLILALAGCSSEPKQQPRHRVTFQTYADEGVPLGGVEILIDGNPAGTSDANGIYRDDFAAPEGHRMRVNFTCPDGHIQPTGTEELTLRKFTPLDEAAKEMGIAKQLFCPPAARLVALAIKTENIGEIPILLHGQEVARTRGGVAHYHLTSPRNTRYDFTLDTSAFPGHTPKNPPCQISVGEADDVYTCETRFEDPAPPPRMRRRRRRRRPAAPAAAAAPPSRMIIRLGGGSRRRR